MRYYLKVVRNVQILHFNDDFEDFHILSFNIGSFIHNAPPPNPLQEAIFWSHIDIPLHIITFDPEYIVKLFIVTVVTPN
jgi:hypothetical protein